MIQLMDIRRMLLCFMIEFKRMFFCKIFLNVIMHTTLLTTAVLLN